MQREERVRCIDVTISELKKIYSLGKEPPEDIKKGYENTINVLKDLKEIVKNGKYI